MTAAQAAQYGPDAFNAWIDAQVRGRSRRHRAQMRRGWQFRQPLIAATRMMRDWVIRNPQLATFFISSIVGIALLWKVNVR